MSACTQCGAEGIEGKRFCSECGAPTSMSSHPTIDSPTELRSSEPTASSSSQRFHPGQIFAGRYRIVAQLGRGGMGEVYRAEDLKLGQSVAIKLLPKDLERDPGLLERLRNEVRLSLQVTHPNVCRVFDIGEVDGRHFLSMEYVDGEDLASLLRRIGRLPQDKAIDVARQLCAGLASAHDEGILHRDLKPANIMIDGRGRAKITDFGLAGATRGIEGAEAMAGTPGYLAPEQLEGKELTVATDIYALGIVLYELFTGERAFPGDTVADVMSRQRSGTRPTVSASGSRPMEPSVERVVMRCLEPEPQSRPQSAKAVAAALPGGDPLAAAIAAGETPSPEMVAEAGGEGSLRPAVAASLLAVVLLALAALPFTPTTNLLDFIPLEKDPSELRLIARSIAAEAGYPDEPVDRAADFSRSKEYFDHVMETSYAPTRWDDLAAVRPAPLYFWYRESPDYLVGLGPWRTVTQEDPPETISGMVSIHLSPSGRLQSFRAVPRQVVPEANPASEPDWDSLFARAELDPANFEPTDPLWTPLAATDIRRAWVQTPRAKSPNIDAEPLRVEAASFAGKPVFFSLIAPWAEPDRMVEAETKDSGIFIVVFQVVIVLVLIGAILLARRNRRLGRSDGRGALRLAIIFFVLTILEFMFTGHHRPTRYQFALVFLSVSWGLFRAAIAWIAYSALEPYVRRLWPDLLIGWTRLLDGRWRDPLVGRQILIGAVIGSAHLYFFEYLYQLADKLANRPYTPWSWSDRLAMSANWGQALGELVEELTPPFFFPIWSTLLLVLLLMICRSKWLASGIFVVGLSLLNSAAPSSADLPFLLTFGLALMFWFWSWFVLTQFGLLVMMMTILFGGWGRFAFGAEVAAWHFPPVAFLLTILALLAGFAFYVSLGGRALFKDVLAE